MSVLLHPGWLTVEDVGQDTGGGPDVRLEVVSQTSSFLRAPLGLGAHRACLANTLPWLDLASQAKVSHHNLWLRSGCPQ